MTHAHLKYACPFTLNDVRIAARKLLGVKLLPPAVEIELLMAVVGYERRLRLLALASMAGSGGEHKALRRVETSSAARLIAFVLANGKGKHVNRMTWEAIKAQAIRVNLRKPSGETVFATQRLKRSGETRWTCSFGPSARAAQRMVEHIVHVVAGPSRYEHARKGRGRETAIRETLDSIKRKGVRWFGLMDVKDFFPSVTREMVEEALWFLPPSIIQSTIFIHDETDISLNALFRENNTSSAFAIRKGIPQGSLASTLVAGKVLERHLDKFVARHVVTQVDNLLVGGKTKKEVQSKITALAISLEGHPSGSLRLTGKIVRLGDHTMTYLGYRFRRKWRRFGGFGRAEPSLQSRQRLFYRLALQMLVSARKQWEQKIDDECARWVRSFPNWEGRFRCEFYAALEAELELVPLLDKARHQFIKSKVRWNSFRDFAASIEITASQLARAVPRMHTQGGPKISTTPKWRAAISGL